MQKLVLLCSFLVAAISLKGGNDSLEARGYISFGVSPIFNMAQHKILEKVFWNPVFSSRIGLSSNVSAGLIRKNFRIGLNFSLERQEFRSNYDTLGFQEEVKIVYSDEKAFFIGPGIEMGYRFIDKRKFFIEANGGFKTLFRYKLASDVHNNKNEVERFTRYDDYAYDKNLLPFTLGLGAGYKLKPNLSLAISGWGRVYGGDNHPPIYSSTPIDLGARVSLTFYYPNKS